jgi:hypothetical protein
MPGFVDVSNMSSEEVRRMGHADDDYEAPRSSQRYTPPAPQTFTADQVWALAVAADRINEGYFKEDQWMANATPPYRSKQANKAMVKEWLRTSNFVEATEADYAVGREYRNYFNTYTLKALTGNLSDFDKQALKIAQMDTFTGRNMLEFAIVSCLPSAARRDQAFNEVKREIYNSEQLAGAVGDVIIGDITVVQCRYNQNYNRFRIQARMGESFIDFWHGQELKGELRIKGKVKAVRGDKTTQLNYVKIIG